MDYVVRYVKEGVGRARDIQSPVKQTSKMEHFSKVVNGFQLLTVFSKLPYLRCTKTEVFHQGFLQ